MTQADAVRAVLFDLDDTLIDWSGAQDAALERTLAQHLEPTGVPAACARTAYGEVLEQNHDDFLRTGRWWTPEDRFRRLVQLLGHDTAPLVGPMTATFSEHVQDVAWLDGALDAVAAARNGDRGVGLLTNGPVPFQRRKVDRLGVADRFDHVAISGETGLWKPDEAAFTAALERLGAQAEETLMVGDSLHFDITPAKRLGMRTAWIAPGGLPEPGLAGTPARGCGHPDADIVLDGPAALARLL